MTKGYPRGLLNQDYFWFIILKNMFFWSLGDVPKIVNYNNKPSTPKEPEPSRNLNH